MAFDFDQDEILRYGRQLILPGVGGAGQLRLGKARVLVVGVGGLGSPVAIYLAAAGVGHLGLVDRDRVELSNLHRQVILRTTDTGQWKVEAARRSLEELNPRIQTTAMALSICPENVEGILAGYDLAIDCTDNFRTRYVLNDACVKQGIPMIHGAVFRYEGQATTILPGQGPCYRCIFPEPPPPGLVPDCQQAGVLGVLPGLLGMIQATEALKYLLGMGELLSGRLLYYEARTMSFRFITVHRDATCPACGSGEGPLNLPEDDCLVNGH